MALLDLIKMIRPPNAFMVSSMVIAGIWFSDPQYIWWKYILAALVPIAYIGIAMVHNDIIDLEIDKINAPHRPLPSGRVSIKDAKIYSGILFVFGTVVGIVVGGFEAIIIMVITLGSSLIYNSKLKKTGFIGNIFVGFTAPSAFLYGDAVPSGWEHFWPPSDWNAAIYLFIISTVLNTSREVAKGIMDVEGDRKFGVRTIAVVHGKSFASKLVLFLLGLALLMAIIPLLTGEFGFLFIFTIIAFLFLILRTGIPLVREPTREHAKTFKTNLLPNMFLALVLVIADIIVQRHTNFYG